MCYRLLTPWAAPVVGLLTGLLCLLWTALWAPRSFDFTDSVFLPAALTGSVMAILAALLWFAGSAAVPGRATLTVR